MSTSAIVLMVFALVTLWGGLALSIVHLRNNPDDPE